MAWMRTAAWPRRAAPPSSRTPRRWRARPPRRPPPGARTAGRGALGARARAPVAARTARVAPYHNDTAVVSAGLGLGASALLGGDDRAEGWVRHAVARAKRHLDAQGADGGAMEGPMYGTYAADVLADVPTLGAADVPVDVSIEGN